MLRIPWSFAVAVIWLGTMGSTLAVAQSAGLPTVDPEVEPASLDSKPSRQKVPPTSRRGAISQGESTSGWWLGPVGIAAALAVVGGVSLASKRFNLNLGLGLNREAGSLQVVGHTKLSTKQSVYLLRVGDRVLILGAGQGGSPTTLGEVTDPHELARLAPGRSSRSAAPSPVVLAGLTRTIRSTTGFDQRIGDDE